MEPAKPKSLSPFIWLTFFALAVVSALLSGCVTRQDDPRRSTSNKRDYEIVRVLYGTDRAPTGLGTPAGFYAGARLPDGRIRVGACFVSIPRTHQFASLEGSASWQLEFQNIPEKHVTLLRVRELGTNEFLRSLRDQVGQTTNKEAVVFIHGYNVTFEDAARRTAQMTYDLKFGGPAILYSWPSQGTEIGYPVDRQNAEVSGYRLARFLREFVNQSGATSVHIVAHSMGNLVMAKALKELNQAAGTTNKPFDEIVMAAPDIDVDEFKELQTAVCCAGKRVTLYASANDVALKASYKFNGHPRVGDTTYAVFCAPGIETLDVSTLDTGILGHSYIGSSSNVVADLRTLLSTHKSPTERGCFQKCSGASGQYWVYQTPR